MFKNKIFRQVIIFIGLLALTFYLLLKDANLNQLSKLINNLDYRYIIVGLFFALCYVLCESVAFKLIFKNFNYRPKWLNLFRYSFIGFYFSAITPSSSGGQPMQIYYMRKDNIAYAHSSLAVLLCVLGYQLSLITLFIISFSFQMSYFASNLSKISFLLIISIIINFALLFFIIGMIFSKKLFPNLIIGIFKLLHKIKLVKNIEEKQVRINNMMIDYHQCADILKSKPILLFQIFGLYLLQLIIRFSISYLVALSLNVSKGNILEFITIQSIILFCVSSLPFPGGIGISETLYITLFSLVIPTYLINPAALITQAINYYFIVVIAAIVVIYSHFKYNK